MLSLTKCIHVFGILLERESMRIWDDIDKWAETVGKNIHMPRPLSDHSKGESTHKYDLLWQKLLKEEMQKPVIL
jgi:hypothetical protein